MADVFNGLSTSNKIKGILASRGKTQGDLARLLEVTPETITNRLQANRWEISELRKIADEFGIEAADLI